MWVDNWSLFWRRRRFQYIRGVRRRLSIRTYKIISTIVHNFILRRGDQHPRQLYTQTHKHTNTNTDTQDQLRHGNCNDVGVYGFVCFVYICGLDLRSSLLPEFERISARTPPPPRDRKPASVGHEYARNIPTTLEEIWRRYAHSDWFWGGRGCVWDKWGNRRIGDKVKGLRGKVGRPK